ncbi:hypothetical protein FCM35_KLT02672 [Carex littledalei]|uniref:Uncharacterized protein n=1 Tax=Carex littledalei TaxID=544730 RepID=A0A833R7K2_9POAL|nr:hypothetical protein FCM35_KLT02672 [Carex littledalei]
MFWLTSPLIITLHQLVYLESISQGLEHAVAGKLTGPDDGINTLFDGLFSDINSDDQINYHTNDLPVRAESPVPDTKKKQKRKQSKLQSEQGNTADGATSEADKKRKKKRNHSKLQAEEGNTANEASTSEAGKMKKENRKKKIVQKETKEGEETKQGNEIPQDKPVVSSSVKAKYVAPHLRATANAESEEIAHTRRRGLDA